MADWDKRWFGIAAEVAGWSKDRVRKVGAVIVDADQRIVSLGYNGFPRGVLDGIDARHERPAKYLWTEHAERNAIYNARGSLAGCRLYTPRFPCADCARALIQVGIVEIVSPPPNLAHPRWGAHYQAALEMLSEAGVSVRPYFDLLPEVLR